MFESDTIAFSAICLKTLDLYFFKTPTWIFQLLSLPQFTLPFIQKAEFSVTSRFNAFFSLHLKANIMKYGCLAKIFSLAFYLIFTPISLSLSE